MANKILYGSIQSIGKDSVGREICVNLKNQEIYVKISKGLTKTLINYKTFYKDFYNQEDQKILTEIQ